jgi:multidrug efflux pump subunit AcrB
MIALSTIVYSSSAPQEIERLIVRPLEDALGDLSRLEKMTSRADATGARILVVGEGVIVVREPSPTTP